MLSEMGFIVFIRLALDVCSLILFVSAIMSWFPSPSESKFEYAIRSAADYLCRPMRALCNRFNIGGQSMFDIPFLFTVIIVAVLQTIIR